MTELAVVVHAMTGALRAARFPADEPIEHVHTLPEPLAGSFARADRIVTAPEARARQTAALLRGGADGRTDDGGAGSSGAASSGAAGSGAASSGAAHIDPALRDIDPGAWAGLGPADLAPDALSAWLTEPGFAPPGGESPSALLERVGGWLDGLGGRRGGTDAPHARRIVAVTHPAVLRAVMVCALDMPEDRFWRVEARPLSALHLRDSARGWTMRV